MWSECGWDAIRLGTEEVMGGTNGDDISQQGISEERERRMGKIPRQKWERWEEWVRMLRVSRRKGSSEREILLRECWFNGSTVTAAKSTSLLLSCQSIVVFGSSNASHPSYSACSASVTSCAVDKPMDVSGSDASPANSCL